MILDVPPGELRIQPVSTRVNNVANDDAGVLEEREEPEEEQDGGVVEHVPEQRKLF
jgi:hypothetical protein